MSDSFYAQNNSIVSHIRTKRFLWIPGVRELFTGYEKHQPGSSTEWLVAASAALRGNCCSQRLCTPPVTIRQVKHFNSVSAGHCPVVWFYAINPLQNTPDPFITKLNSHTMFKPPKTVFGSKFRPDVFVSLYSNFSPMIRLISCANPSEKSCRN